MKLFVSILFMASDPHVAAAGDGPPGDTCGPPDVQAANEGGDPESPRDCLVWRRAHTLVCTNAIDGSPSFLSYSLCADGCGNTVEEATNAATLSLSTQTCLGPGWGCCDYYVDDNFNVCGGG